MRRYLHHLLARFHADEAGAVLVEMTLITPLMITLSAGVFEFSNIIHRRLLIEAGVTDAARYIARCVHEDSDKATCGTAGANLATTGTTDGSGPARVANWTSQNVTVTYIATPVTVDPTTGEQNYRSSSDNVNVVQVSTSYSYAGTGLLDFLGFSPLTLKVAHQERVVGW